jgi:hypothetical protein
MNEFAPLSDEAFIQHAFVVHFRQPCAPTRAVEYLQRLRAGASRESVWTEIHTSAALGWRGQTAFDDGKLVAMLELSGTNFVEQAYLHILGRHADAAGLTHYADRLRIGDPKKLVLYHLLTSEEGRIRADRVPYLRRLTDALRHEVGVFGIVRLFRLLSLEGEMFVRAAYKAVLARNVDTSGLATYREALARGTPKISILRALAESEEGGRTSRTTTVRMVLKSARIIELVKRLV